VTNPKEHAMSVTRIRRAVAASTIAAGAVAVAALIGPAASASEDPHAGPLTGIQLEHPVDIGGDFEPTQFLDCFGRPYFPATAIYAQPLNTTYGTSGDDVIFGTSGNDVIVALEGDDRVCAGDGDDDIFGDEWFAWYDTEGDPGGGDDLLDGEAGDDVVYGAAGADLLHGGRNEDLLNGGDGYDIHYAQKDDDNITCGDGYDYAYGGDGSDDSTVDCEVWYQ
jgi:Ca2+-binding RTX toxin-like protein